MVLLLNFELTNVDLLSCISEDVCEKENSLIEVDVLNDIALELDLFLLTKAILEEDIFEESLCVWI